MAARVQPQNASDSREWTCSGVAARTVVHMIHELACWLQVPNAKRVSVVPDGRSEYEGKGWVLEQLLAHQRDDARDDARESDGESDGEVD